MFSFISSSQTFLSPGCAFTPPTAWGSWGCSAAVPARQQFWLFCWARGACHCGEWAFHLLLPTGASWHPRLVSRGSWGLFIIKLQEYFFIIKESSVLDVSLLRCVLQIIFSQTVTCLFIFSKFFFFFLLNRSLILRTLILSFFFACLVCVHVHMCVHTCMHLV